MNIKLSEESDTLGSTRTSFLAEVGKTTFVFVC